MMGSEKYKDIKVQCHNRVTRIVLNRPDKLNAIRINTYRELISAFKAADDSPDCHLIVLAGEGNHFTAGNDLADLAGPDKLVVMDCVQEIFSTVAQLKKVLVAVVEGVAVGIGTTILLHCDLVIASSKTKFRLPFANLGVCPEGGSSLLLAQAIGQKRAMELLLSGRFFSAEEALSWGLINKVTEPGKVAEVAAGYLEELLQQPLASLMATKQLLRISRLDTETAIKEELKVFTELLQKDEVQKRIAALLKR